MSKRFSEPEIEQGLVALVEASGNGREASRMLSDAGVSIDQATLYRWASKDHKDRYEEVRAQFLPEIRRRAADRHMAAADAQIAVTVKLTERLNEHAEDVPPRDLAGSIRNVTTAAAVHTDKAQLLNGQPTEIRTHRSVKELMRSLKDRVEIIEGEAEEIDSPALGSGS